jgi:hypothetical protein
MNGKRLYSAIFTGGTQRIPVDRFPTGIYALVIMQEQERVVHKVLIRH